MDVRDLNPLAMVLTVMIVIDALITPIILLWAGLAPDNYSLTVMPVAGAVDGWTMGFRILMMIVFAVWIYRAGTNLLAAGYDDLEFTPASRIWWFAVPIACLFKPFQGMRELWNASHNDTDYSATNEIVAFWWASWIVMSFFTPVMRLFAGPAGPGVTSMWVAVAVDGAAAVMAILLVQRITAAQSRLSNDELDEVFA
jgi:hypothetical protein